MSTTRPIRTIGYIGLGKAGYSLASVLSRSSSYSLIVQDADRTRAELFIKEHGNATVATTNASLNEIDVLITMLLNGSIVRSNGTIIIDTSSSSPFHTRDTAELLRNLNPTLILIDSSVTQEYAFALSKGDATLMVGCSDPNALERAMPVLKCMGRYVFYMGSLGAGHAMKGLNNYVSCASILGLCDAFVAGQKFGLEPSRMVEVMNRGTGGIFRRGRGLTRRFKSGYQLQLLLKDMKFARKVIEEMGVTLSLPGLIVRELEEAVEVAGEGPDHTEVIKAWERRAGVELIRSKL
ncbi:hypothetical protein CLAFUW4_02578 [Fulvia fulva]|uniref:NAD(P)-dependent oxidoreductase n=1 Tax=Passalora fulva TaxID=5499 RepID=A0A9Q8LB86_PASFU|nr:uncharacterized protein CLAFUR5_02567 [Fulvia fulva]KAK4632299.1 hypothetical protein CLAFUR4_02573 [Fulvia fulva]UJO14171.1 hypothetical protein CLAFUR5_02567 [Fulvia fulva]WPV11826.1 hypothetical protein CLAFUW4_02578 [Fulvia fulva]WPV25980.1 hypothetical protein CLAFUW7_02578 [Fulvia fulva]